MRPAAGQIGVPVVQRIARRLPTIAAFPSSPRISFAPGVSPVPDAHTVPCGPCRTRFPSSCITALVTFFPAVPDVHTGTPSRARTRSPSAWSVSVSGRVLAVSDAPGKSASVARRRSPVAAAHSVTVPDCHTTLWSAPYTTRLPSSCTTRRAPRCPFVFVCHTTFRLPTSARFPPARISACVAPLPAVPDAHSVSAPDLSSTRSPSACMTSVTGRVGACSRRPAARVCPGPRTLVIAGTVSRPGRVRQPRLG